ncbi:MULTISPECIES: hypothetical protein [Sinorhizobium]|uniref:Uncharacterized protein n=1 Tax=Sinorhizobium americanum TaxID=194963 RepID=A0A2S3YN87_9HYPH|nr:MULTISPECIES: hypothetical protein [Sinorhizobium]PDT33063.1 hypothetical protein CO656_28840 [Sinorhizobium sp. FG01]PDT49486.1 hypothetical protein CO664_27440 [Sinorhizobium sp. NG07B]POH30549.1 hypothetical protein ATY31_14755 [Sinorhizobium americanum]POH33319.1 hypothetical protein ATY30_02560 [Sinorhizobium americanum]
MIAGIRVKLDLQVPMPVLLLQRMLDLSRRFVAARHATPEGGPPTSPQARRCEHRVEWTCNSRPHEPSAARHRPVTAVIFERYFWTSHR